MRNFYHIFIGFSLMYLIGCLTEFSTYTIDGKLIGVPIVSFFIGFVFGFFWDWLQEKLSKGKIKFDWNDVLRSAIGSFIGGIASLFIVSQSIMISTCIVSIILVLNDIKYLRK